MEKPISAVTPLGENGDLGNQMSKGIQEISAKCRKLLQGAKNYSMKILTTFSWKVFLIPKGVQRLTWLPPPAGSEQSQLWGGSETQVTQR